MAAMRLMHVGFEAHVVGGVTTPSLVLDLTGGDPRVHEAMFARHANLE